jgi:hypothetical protein
MSELWAWLKDEHNQKALALIGGFFAFLWTAGWGVFVYARPPKGPRDTHKGPSSPPARERGNNRRRTQRLYYRSILAYPAFWIWGGGTAVAIAAYSAWLAYFHQPTIVKDVRVCVGEYEGSCPPHDVFVGCSNPNVWAANACIKFTSVKLSDVSGNKCGYALFQIACSQAKR